MRYQLMLARQRFTALSVGQIQNSLLALIGRRSQRLDDLRHRLALVAHRGLRERSSKVAVLQARLQRRNPSIRLALARRRLEVASQSLSRLAHAALAARRTRLDRAAARLDALSPLAVLNRGYALIYLEGGTGARQLLRNATDAHPGQTIRARLADGSVTAEVRSTQSA
jgi:exodeoxyribonuclease VII large subunit